jgi:hypothetical protein
MGTADACLSCKIGLERTMMTPECGCNIGYYDDGINTHC